MKTTYIKNTLYLLALFITAFIACEKDDGEVTGQPEMVSKDIIASDGGEITTTGGITLVIPANSLPEDVNVSFGISGNEPTTIPNEDLIINGTPFTVSIPCDTLIKPVKIIVPKPSDMTTDNTSVFAFNGNSYFPLFYEFNGNKVEISLDIINWENNKKKFLPKSLTVTILKQKQTPDQVMMGLKEVSVSNNKLVYSDIPQVNPNSRILLMIHGWIGSPQTWDEFVPKIQSHQDLGYTNYWTFGYNSSFSIDDNGKLLSDLIKANANGAKIDIVAHSMGGLVSRAAIENHGCHQHINSLITLGTPHLGSDLAVTRYIIGYYVSLSEPWHLFSYNANSQGYKDLNTFSSFLTQLNQNQPSSVPYHTIACINNPDEWRLSNTAFLPGPDDGIVTVHSAKTVDGASQPLQDVTIDIGKAHTIMTRDEDIFDQVLAYLNHSESTTEGNIYFLSDESENNNIYLGELSGNQIVNIQQVTNYTGNDRVFAYDVCKTTGRILYAVTQDGHRGDLYLLETISSNPTLIPNQPNDRIGPLVKWAPDGNSFLFSIGAPQYYTNLQIATMNHDGSNYQILVSTNQPMNRACHKTTILWLDDGMYLGVTP